MKTYSITALVLGMLCLQSCFSSSGKQIEATTNSTIETTPITHRMFNKINIDSLNQAVLFVDMVDDELATAYTHCYVNDGAKQIMYYVAVPYDCMKYDKAVNLYILDAAKFYTALQNPKNTANIFVDKNTLVGYTYKNIDKHSI